MKLKFYLNRNHLLYFLLFFRLVSEYVSEFHCYLNVTILQAGL